MLRKEPAQRPRAVGAAGLHLLPEVELTILSFSILGKLWAEIGEFQAPSLPRPSPLTEMVIFSDHLCLCPNTLCCLGARTSLFKTPKTRRTKFHSLPCLQGERSKILQLPLPPSLCTTYNYKQLKVIK